MNKKISVRIGIAVLLFSLVLLLLSTYYLPHLIEFVRVHFSPDNNINSIGEAKIKLRLYFLIGCIFLLGLFFIYDMFNKLIEIIPFNRISDDIKRVFFQDPVCARKNTAKYFFIISTTIALLTQFSVVAFGEPEWEGTTDKYSSSLFLIAVILLLIPIRRLRKLEINPVVKRKIKRGLLSLSILFFVFYGEEISWGQQYFEIETAPLFDLNYQKENTLHNFFNPLFDYIYAAVGITFFLLLTYFWLVSSHNGVLTNLFLPHVSLFVFFLSMTGSVYSGESDELYEAYLGIFSVMYAIRLNLCIKYPTEWFIRYENIKTKSKEVSKSVRVPILEKEQVSFNMNRSR